MPCSSSSDMASKRSARALTSSASSSNSLSCLSAPRDRRPLKERAINLSGLRITSSRRFHRSREPGAFSLTSVLPCPSRPFWTRPVALSLSEGAVPSCPSSAVDSIASGPSPASLSLVRPGFSFPLTFEGLCSSSPPGLPSGLPLSSPEEPNSWFLDMCVEPAEASLLPFSPPSCASPS